MHTLNAMQLKAHINNYAIKNHLPPQHVLQSYLIERFIVRLTNSPFYNHFILKGGLLVSAKLGLKYRTTMDIDATAQSISMNRESLMTAMETIAATNVDDPIHYKIIDVTPINEHNNYPGFRAEFSAEYEKIKAQLLIDITTGDAITPSPVLTKIPRLFEEEAISVWTYPIETLLAEKLETILSRGELNSRPRDFYDVYALTTMRMSEIDSRILHQALVRTCQMRATQHLLPNANSILAEVENSPRIQSHWSVYQRKFDYARSITFVEAINSVRILLDAALVRAC